MGFREVTVRESVTQSIAEVAWYLESEGLLAAAEKFTDDVYDFIFRLGDDRKAHRTCRDPERALMGYKCVAFQKKYTIVFIEQANDIIICEFIPSKMIYW